MDQLDVGEGAILQGKALENAAAARVKLSDHELATITALIDEFPTLPPR